MADNIAVTPGSGTNVATDERTIAATTVHVPRYVPIGGTSGAAGQVTITNSSTTIAAAAATRLRLIIVNRQTVAVFIDPSGGTATTAMFRLDPGESVTLQVTSLVTAITAAAYSASGDAKVHYIEETSA